MNNKDIEKKEKRKKQAIERSNQLNNESEIFKELVIDIKKLDSTSSFLGIIKIEYKNNDLLLNSKPIRLMTNENNIINNNYLRPKNYKLIEETIDAIIIWGAESPQELFQKIISVKKEFVKEICINILNIMIICNREKMIKCFKLIRSYDEKLYNSFEDYVLNALGLEKTKKWWDPLSW